MKQLHAVLFFLIIFLVPTNLFLTFAQQSGYVTGFFIDYLVPKLYLIDIVILLHSTTGIWLTRSAKSLQLYALIVLVTLMGIALQWLVAAAPLASLWYTTSIGALTLWTVSTWKSWNFISKDRLLYVLIATVFFQAAIGLYQVIAQHSLAGYWLLGEPDLSRTIGIVRHTIQGVEYVVPYGTTAHPNVLAGVLVLYPTLIWHLFVQTKRQTAARTWAVYCSMLLGLTIVAITGSSSASIAAVIAASTYIYDQYHRKIHSGASSVPLQISAQRLFRIFFIISVAVPVVLAAAQVGTPDALSVTRRASLNSVALQLFMGHPLQGVGLNSFTAALVPYSTTSEIVRFIQPAHHVGLLFLAEAGLIGCVLVFLLLKKALDRHPKLPALLLVLIPLATLDHYLLTLRTGMLVSILFVITVLQLTKAAPKKQSH